METTLGALLRALNQQQQNEEGSDERLEKLAKLLEDFNKSNEMRFRFDQDRVQTSEQEKEVFYAVLNSSWTFLNSRSSDLTLIGKHVRLVSACLNSIRIVSRDSEIVKIFENPKLLELIQTIADLNFHEDKINISNASEEKQHSVTQSTTNTTDWQLTVRLHALKSISNLIYNSKAVQDFYIQNGVAEMITIYLKQFSPAEFLSSSGNSEANKQALSVVMFNLRVLFLLTVFSRELRNKLREKLQVVTYLIEIIDQVMKERLNGCLAAAAAAAAAAAQDANGCGAIGDDQLSGGDLVPADYCLLKIVDVDFIIEILKILYNLTMDTVPHSKVQMSSFGVGSNTSSSSSSAIVSSGSSISNNNEEEEAHLMHLVSVLRDLITCRLETTGSESGVELSSSTISNPKLIDLHSNIINLLTNMPSTCYEELLSPINPVPNTSLNSSFSSANSAINNQAKQNSSYYLNVRMAHNRKRISRRSKRIKQKQQQQEEKNRQQQQAIDDLTLTIDDQDVEFEGKNMEAVSIILAFMNRHVNTYLASPNSSNADALCPVLLLLSLMSKSNKLIRQYCRLKVLPPLKRADLLRLPEQGNHLRNKLVRLMTDVHLQLKRLSAQFLFVLCKESVQRLIKYTGFGNAAGLLAEMGLLLSKKGGDTAAYSSSDSADDQGSDTEDYKQLEACINPVTGRAYTEAPSNPFEGMSEEQKEYEAMRLANDLDRLTRLSGAGIKPARIGPDGRPIAVEHVLELQEAILKAKQENND